VRSNLRRIASVAVVGMLLVALAWMLTSKSRPPDMVIRFDGTDCSFAASERDEEIATTIELFNQSEEEVIFLLADLLDTTTLRGMHESATALRGRAWGEDALVGLVVANTPFSGGPIAEDVNARTVERITLELPRRRLGVWCITSPAGTNSAHVGGILDRMGSDRTS